LYKLSSPSPTSGGKGTIFSLRGGPPKKIMETLDFEWSAKTLCFTLLNLPLLITCIKIPTTQIIIFQFLKKIKAIMGFLKFFFLGVLYVTLGKRGMDRPRKVLASMRERIFKKIKRNSLGKSAKNMINSVK
jgi:hypothetical protein